MCACMVPLAVVINGVVVSGVVAVLSSSAPSENESTLQYWFGSRRGWQQNGQQLPEGNALHLRYGWAAAR